MTRAPAQLAELDLSEAKKIVERAALGDSERKLLLSVIDVLVFVVGALETKRVTIVRLRRMIFGASTEKTGHVCGDEKNNAKEAKALAAGNKPKRKGHGKNPTSRYPGATKNSIQHPTLHAGDRCPGCERGTLGKRAPLTLIRLRGQAPVVGQQDEYERFRCSTCGEVFTACAAGSTGKQPRAAKAKEPVEQAPSTPGAVVEQPKYDVTVAVMIALLRYGYGLPFNRFAQLQAGLGVPLPATTQWDVLCRHLAGPETAYDELIHQAAQGEVVHNDDTTMKVLTLMGGSAKTQTPNAASGERSSERTGIFTTGIVALAGGQRIAVFFTGHRHAGENLRSVLGHRASGLSPPVQMCDGISRNLPDDFATILANCLSHSRRRYVDVFANFPDQCRHVLEQLRDVYRNDAIAREEKMSPQARLEWHQQQSGPIMAELEEWLGAQLEEKLVEPNSGLGEAIEYMRKHWHALTQFLRVPGAPLDNNICERALKKAIMHRKNSLFYRTERGAHVGDVFMSLIHTAELCGESPFDYLRALMAHPKDVAAHPAEWLPWNYRQSVAAAA
ncbi:IS66 family transposase [bacterium]|nr:IS66 family transposase [bacterium]